MAVLTLELYGKKLKKLTFGDTQTHIRIEDIVNLTISYSGISLKESVLQVTIMLREVGSPIVFYIEGWTAELRALIKAFKSGKRIMPITIHAWDNILWATPKDYISKKRRQ